MDSQFKSYPELLNAGDGIGITMHNTVSFNFCLQTHAKIDHDELKQLNQFVEECNTRPNNEGHLTSVTFVVHITLLRYKLELTSDSPLTLDDITHKRLPRLIWSARKQISPCVCACAQNQQAIIFNFSREF